MRTLVGPFAAVAILALVSCANEDPLGSHEENGADPSGKLVVSGAVAGDCNRPGCRPGFGGARGVFGRPPAPLPRISHIAAPDLPTIDGDISDWHALRAGPDLGQLHFTSIAGEVSGIVAEADQKVEVWLGWNHQTNLIYVAGRVTDDQFGTNTDPTNVARVYHSDDMEVYIDADNSGGPYSADDLQAQQYALNPAGGIGVVRLPDLVENPPGVMWAVRKTGTVYTYELAIPGLNAAGSRHSFQDGEVIGFSMAFQDYESDLDADGARYHAFNSLKGTIGAWENADVFPDFQLGGQ